MPAKTSPASKKVRKNTGSKKPAQKTDADKIRALEKQLAQREAELVVINSIQTALASNLGFQGIIDIVGDKLNEIFRDGNIGIGLIDKERNIVSIPYVIENGKRLEPFEVSLDEPSVMQHIVKRRRPVLINSKFQERFGRNDAISFPGRDQRDLKSWLSVPFFKGKEVIGGMSLRSWERENAFTESDVQLLQTVANSMIVALENARLFDETQHLLKETEQRATELQIINNIGITLTEGLDLNSTLERVGERLLEALGIQSMAIVAFDPQAGMPISNYFYHYGRRFTPQRFSMSNYKYGMRFAAKVGSKPWVVNIDVEKYWKKFGTDILTEWTEIPKAFVVVPMLAGRELVGSITIADYENENAFVNLPLNLLETIASNMGTAIQNVHLFDETQRLLKETEQRATELQIINNIGQTLTEGGDLESTVQRVGERLHMLLKVNDFGITAFDLTEKGLAVHHYVVRKGQRITPENFSLSKYRLGMRLAARRGGRPWVVNDNAAKYWDKIGSATDKNETPKSFVMLPMRADLELVGSITIADFDNENAFQNLPMDMLETIASNIGTAIQNVRLVDETKRLFKEARESRVVAEQANKAKSTFLANMSHELRTPLHAIIGFTELVKEKSEGVLPPKQINNLEKVLASSQHLLGLINSVLDLSKIEAGRMDVIPAKFSLNMLIDLCTNLAMPLLKPGVTLEKQLDETIGVIYSDQDKIKQIVLNLLSNAAKFTHQGHILLRVEKANPETLKVSITDSGIGISSDAIERVFEEFQQADSTTTRKYGGTGLGLPISRNLARLLGGNLTATSELGKGSTFTLTIPTQYGRKPAPSSDYQPDRVRSAESNAQAGTLQP